MKQRIHQYIEMADERLLRIVDAIIKEDQNTIVAYTVSGKPLTLSEYKEELAKSETEITEGKFISDEDLGKEIENWFNE